MSLNLVETNHQLIIHIFFRNLRIYLTKIVINILIKVLSIDGHYFFPSLYQLERMTSFLRQSNHRPNSCIVRIWSEELLLAQAMCHRSKQAVVGRSDIWGIRRMAGRTSHFSVPNFPNSVLVC